MPGCAKYKAQHVVQEEKVFNTFKEQKENIDLTIRVFGQEKFKDYLSAYQPIHLHLKNKTAHRQELAINDISLPTETLKTLKKQEPKLFSINYIPCVLASILGIFFWWEFVLPSALILGSCATQASIMQYERSIKYLKNNTKFPNETLTIAPFSSVDTLIFVKQTQYTPRFNLTIKTPAIKTSTIFNVVITARTAHAYHIN